MSLERIHSQISPIYLLNQSVHTFITICITLYTFGFGVENIQGWGWEEL